VPGRKIAIVGSRVLRPRKQIYDLLVGKPGNTIVISGGARGVDEVAEEIARHLRLEVEIFPADWDTYGMSAGYLRNKQIVEAADEIFVYWDGVSRGSMHTINLARAAGKPLTIVRMKPPRAPRRQLTLKNVA
jgi:predicted Rossmann fold nucleotide-binding protein DprA/Smf involved in DNA uptake